MVDLDPTQGHEQKSRRPCIVVSSDEVIALQRFPVIVVIGRGPGVLVGPGVCLEAHAFSYGQRFAATCSEKASGEEGGDDGGAAAGESGQGICHPASSTPGRSIGKHRQR